MVKYSTLNARCQLSPNSIFITMGQTRCRRTCSFRRFIQGFFVAVAIYIGFYSYYTYYYHYVVKYDTAFVNLNIDAACVLPDLDPFHESIQRYIYQPEPLRCSKDYEYTYLDNTGILHINRTAVRSSGVKLDKCEYMVIRRPHDNDKKIFFDNPVTFSDSVDVKADFFKVICKDSAQKILYNNVHSHIYPTSPKKQSFKNAPNVLIIGLDSMSRLNFIRRMPKTYRYLTENLKGLVFKGFNSVGGYSSANIYPMLMGLDHWDHELYSTDSMPIIWKNFSDKGYVTLYSEDKPSYSTFQNFHIQPTTHYQCPFWLSLEENRFMDGLGLFVADRGINVGTSVLCHGRIPKHVFQINYLKEFALKYEAPKFAFVWNNLLAHDWINLVQVADDDYVSLLMNLADAGQLDNTFVVVMSDHGNRFDWIRHTMHGRVEERMPFLAIKPPVWFKSKHAEAYARLQSNTNKLITPFDLHEVLADVMNNQYNDRTPNSGRLPRGLSLFSTVPTSRTCSQAAIDEHFCACYGIKEIDTNSPLARNLANHIVSEVNKVILPYEKLCFQLKLSKVKTVYESHSEFSTKGKSYIVSIQTSPSGAIFEATVKHIGTNFELGGDISRINKYGDQSHCITIQSRDLHKFCYCKNKPK